MMVASTRRYLFLGAVVQGFIAWASAILVAIVFVADPDVFVVDGGAFGKQLHRTFEFVNANANPRLQAGSSHSLAMHYAQHSHLISNIRPRIRFQAHLVAIY
jgi:predicted NBD/HSP70 family sugar kinase